MNVKRKFRRLDLGNAVIAVTLVFAALSAMLYFLVVRPKPPEFETRSDYSHIRIRRDAGLRTLVFVRDNGYEAIESRIDIEAPHNLILPYSQGMFASYLYQPNQERVLIVGLGGGAMVHFLKHYDPNLKVDVVEIDPVVVRLADQYFGVRSEGNIRILTTDGFDYLAHSTEKYSVIYMDAFLRPSADTDQVGIPARLKTVAFYDSMQDRLLPGGLVVFNLNNHQHIDGDIEGIRQSFASATVFHCRPAYNIIVVARTGYEPIDAETLVTRAKALDQRFQANFSFRKLLANRQSIE